MIDMLQAYDRWLDAHGQHHPVWDYDRLHTWLNEHHPRWMYLRGDELDTALGEAMEEEFATEERADEERRELHEEQAQKYGAGPSSASEED